MVEIEHVDGRGKVGHYLKTNRIMETSHGDPGTTN